nr:hypothetical protein [Moritella viscosa]SHO14693.1 Chaperone protein ClpB [Moritella viscosa]
MWKESSKSVKCAVVFIFSMLAINTVSTVGAIANNQKLEAELAVITKQCSQVDSAGYCELTEEQANQAELDLRAFYDLDLEMVNTDAVTEVNAELAQAIHKSNLKKHTLQGYELPSTKTVDPELMQRLAYYQVVEDQRNRAFEAETVNYWELVSRLALYLTGIALMIVMVTRKDKNSKAFLMGEAKPEDKSQEQNSMCDYFPSSIEEYNKHSDKWERLGKLCDGKDPDELVAIYKEIQIEIMEEEKAKQQEEDKA